MTTAITSASSSAAKPRRLLLGVSGSVATIKLLDIIGLVIDSYEVQVVTTKSASHFFSKEEIKLKFPSVRIYEDQDEWDSWKKRGDPVLHIELRKWADVMLIAPLSANTLAKISNGLSDNLLTSVARAWDWKKLLVVAPAMNTAMWEHPITAEQLNYIQKFGVLIIPPISKTLMCGDTGSGAMAEPATIVQVLATKLSTPSCQYSSM